MKLCRFQIGADAPARVGLVLPDTGDASAIFDLSAAGIVSLSSLLESPKLPEVLAALARLDLPCHPWASASLLPPVESQEIWAAGVTYLRSKRARQEETDFSAQAYEKVYEADRPEIFFKALGEKVSGPGGPAGIRGDATRSVPEPELAIVLNSRGELVGCTLGNDMSSRDIEGSNLLYLPQAKIYTHSCCLGPAIAIGGDEAAIKSWTVALEIWRDAQIVFQGETCFGQIKRTFRELAEYLYRSQRFPRGAVLLTGTGIVPPFEFALRAGDRVRISCPAIGVLENRVVVV